MTSTVVIRMGVCGGEGSHVFRHYLQNVTKGKRSILREHYHRITETG